MTPVASPIIVRTESDGFLTNAYLVADKPGGSAVLVDSNGVIEPLLAAAKEHDLTIERMLITHHHYDHVIQHEADAQAAGGVPIQALKQTGQLIDGVSEFFEDGDKIKVGELEIEVAYTPGHCSDHVALLIKPGGGAPTDVITADVLFKGTVGGTLFGGPKGFEHLKSSILDRLMVLDDTVNVHPGHREPTTIGEERANNPFITYWTGPHTEGGEQVEVFGLEAGGIDDGPATLVLWAPDYDGGNKAWVKLQDGSDVIVGGSRVRRQSQ